MDLEFSYFLGEKVGRADVYGGSGFVVFVEEASVRFGVLRELFVVDF